MGKTHIYKWGGDTYINGEKTRIFATYLKEEKPIFELGKKLANYVLIYIYNRRNHQAPKYLFVHTRAPAKAHSESAYDFPGLTPVPALLSRPFLDACYFSALVTSSASKTSPASGPVIGDRSTVSSLQPSCMLDHKGIAYTPSRSTTVRSGALGNGSTTYALRGVAC